MYCKWCGMDSRDEKICEWCRKPFPSAEEETPEPGPEPFDPNKAYTEETPGTEFQMPTIDTVQANPLQTAVNQPPAEGPAAFTMPILSSEKEEEPARQEAAEIQQPEPTQVQQPATAQPPQTPAPENTEVKTAPVQAPPPPQEKPEVPVTVGYIDPRIRLKEAKEADEEVEDIVLPFRERLERFLGVILLVLPAGILLARFDPNHWLAYFMIAVAISGFVMGSFRVIQFFDDELADVGILLLAFAFVGPFYAAAGYAIVGLLRKDVNFSIIGLMISYTIIYLLIGSAANGLAVTFKSIAFLSLTIDYMSMLYRILLVSTTFIGWMFASFFRPFNLKDSAF